MTNLAFFRLDNVTEAIKFFHKEVTLLDLPCYAGFS